MHIVNYYYLSNEINKNNKRWKLSIQEEKKNEEEENIQQ